MKYTAMVLPDPLTQVPGLVARLSVLRRTGTEVVFVNKGAVVELSVGDKVTSLRGRVLLVANERTPFSRATVNSDPKSGEKSSVVVGPNDFAQGPEVTLVPTDDNMRHMTGRALR